MKTPRYGPPLERSLLVDFLPGRALSKHSLAEHPRPSHGKPMS
jgi:hypothetical protein